MAATTPVYLSATAPPMFGLPLDPSELPVGHAAEFASVEIPGLAGSSRFLLREAERRIRAKGAKANLAGLGLTSLPIPRK